jgi:tetratricopeptide (TPR) repeat protein
MKRAVVFAVSLLLTGVAWADDKRPEPDMCVAPPGAQPLLPAKLLEGQGTTNMAVTTQSADARAFFNQGVSQLHSFWAVEAERSFLQAAAFDPGMAMAYWGISAAAAGDHRSSFQNVRGGSGAKRTANAIKADEKTLRTANGAAVDGQIRARENIEKAMSLRDKATPRERLWIEAEWARRNPASKDQDADYIAAMRKLVAAYPEDAEARSFLGLALLYGFELPSHDPRPGTLEGIGMLEEIVAKDDNHFGAHHYLIHAYEGSATPEKAWHSCERYPQLVTNIPHALHMPGHIYAQSDRIDDAVMAFTEAAANELGYLNADILYSNQHHGHNVHFLIHSLNLEGRYQESLLQARSLLAIKESPRERANETGRSTWRQGHFALIRTLVRFERWPEILDGRTIPQYEQPEQRGWRAWAIGLAQSAGGNAAAARESLRELNDVVAKMKPAPATLEIAAMELRATLDARNGDTANAWRLFGKAVDREEALYYAEPPPYPRPVAEGWGNVALEKQDFEVADRAYTKALTKEPGSGRAYLGRSKALQGLGRAAESADLLQRARVAWNKADPQLP